MCLSSPKKRNVFVISPPSTPKQQKTSGSSGCTKKAISGLCEHWIWSQDTRTHHLGSAGWAVSVKFPLSAFSALSKDSSQLPPTEVVPVPPSSGALGDLSLWGFSPQWGSGAVLAQAQPQHRHMTFVQSKQTLPGEPHELLRCSANIFFLTTPHSVFPWNMNSPDSFSSYYCALTPHTAGMEREMQELAV